MPMIAELREIGGALWARVPLAEGAGRIQILSDAEVTQNDARLARLLSENDRLRAALAPFMEYYNDIRFNLRKQPRPTDAAIEERGERVACVTWAEFYALRDALNDEQTTGEKDNV